MKSKKTVIFASILGFYGLFLTGCFGSDGRCFGSSTSNNVSPTSSSSDPIDPTDPV